MYQLAVGLAVGAAFLIAVGAALQSRSAVRVRFTDDSRLGFLIVLIRQRRWLAGAVVSVCGVGVHVVALSLGPVSAIQPVGTVGLIFAVAAKAALDRARPSARAVSGAVVVIVGLAAFLLVLPPGEGRPQVPARGAVGMAVIALGIAGVALALPRERVGVNVRAAAAATGAGASFGVGAALIGVIGRRLARSVDTVLAWPTVVVIILMLAGGVAQQYAYGLARFAEVYAVVLVADPFTAAFTGVVVLRDPIPTAPLDLAWLAVAAALTAAGVVVLSRDHPARARGQAG
ncbi:MAG TPA: DMT family transporter [Flexivirga sp.]|uniref:DMT family transporter n=1 Tax=Flexivirga sp. TaxID=1962927 RepID=UPI002C7F122A|nr:DMT family transporter [Flexivirga sp.]HWC22814.1 DMT family transporter [Flexivirga sp.]